MNYLVTYNKYYVEYESLYKLGNALVTRAIDIWNEKTNWNNPRSDLESGRA